MQEILDFLRFESRHGPRVLFGDILRVHKAFNQKNEIKSLLDSLGDVKMTFFVSSKRLGVHHKLVDRFISEGHEIASHGHDHVLLGEKDKDEMGRQLGYDVDAFASIGVKKMGFRPPFLSDGFDLRIMLQKLKYRYISAESLDYWKEVPVMRPYDWEQLVVMRRKREFVIKDMRHRLKLNVKRAVLFHPWILSKDIKMIVKDLKTKDRRVRHCKKVSLSCDIY